MFIFPGQGSQYVGMGRDMHAEFSVVRRVYDKASEVLGHDIANLSFNGPKDRLGKTEFTQLALLTHSISCLELFKELTNNRITPTVTAGHSLGEYAALVAAGSLTLEAALRLVQKRGELMSAYGRGKMVALKLDVDTVRKFASSFYCGIGGCNLPDQTVVGGAEDDLRSLAEFAKSKHRIRATLLPTEGAFHTYLMIEAAVQLRPVLDTTQLTSPLPQIKVLSNYSGRYHEGDPSTIKAHLFFQLFNPVKWIWGMQKALRDGVNTVIEFGGGIGEERGPHEKRPNLESITRRALLKSHNAIYVPAINNTTIKEAARFLTSLEKVVERPADDSGNAVDENWFHLFLPVRNGMVTENSIGAIKLVDELGLSKAVQLVATPADRYKELIGHTLDDAKDVHPCLELVAGCETAAPVPYWNDAIRSELIRLRGRLEHSDYGDKSIAQPT
jgi:malonyl CoA-acyl carrier protein transacylase